MAIRKYTYKYDHRFIYELSKKGISYNEIIKIVGGKIRIGNIHQIVKHQALLEQINGKLEVQGDKK